MTFLYSLITLPLSLIYSIVLLFSERGRTGICERFGLWKAVPDNVVWFHAASVGEVQGILPVINKLNKEQLPPILLTVTSTTALMKASEITPYVRLLPFDSYLWIYLALKNTSVRLMVISETEIWPALYLYLAAHKIPLVIVNGRLSEGSVVTYQLLHKFFPRLYASIKKLLCVDDLMLSRFVTVGVPQTVIEVAGNTKYCRTPLTIEKGLLKKERFEESGKLIVIGNIRPGEETVLFPAIKNFLNKDPSPLFAIVPRHPDKFEYFAGLLRQHGVPFVRWSEELRVPRGAVLFVDAFGVLEQLYADSQGAFIGGSLQNFGGHNPMEPAPYRVAVAIGPFTGSSGALVPKLVADTCIDQVRSQVEVEIFFDSVNSGEAVRLAQNLYTFWIKQQGAVEKAVLEIKKVLKDA